MELIPGFGRPELTGTYFGLFYVVSGIAAAVGNTVVGWAMDAGERGGAAWLPWACCCACSGSPRRPASPGCTGWRALPAAPCAPSSPRQPTEKSSA